MPRSPIPAPGGNDNLPTGLTIDFEQLVQTSGLEEDTLLQRIAQTLSKRDRNGADVAAGSGCAE